MLMSSLDPVSKRRDNIVPLVLRSIEVSLSLGPRIAFKQNKIIMIPNMEPTQTQIMLIS
jgi:hypothetical protein